MKDGYNSGGYEWCVENWGTKWGFYDVQTAPRKRGLFYTFRTAWSPPAPLVMAMSRAFPDLTFKLRYYEGGAAYKGLFLAAHGEVLGAICRALPSMS